MQFGRRRCEMFSTKSEGEIRIWLHRLKFVVATSSNMFESRIMVSSVFFISMQYIVVFINSWYFFKCGNLVSCTYHVRAVYTHDTSYTVRWTRIHYDMYVQCTSYTVRCTMYHIHRVRRCVRAVYVHNQIVYYKQ